MVLTAMMVEGGSAMLAPVENVRSLSDLRAYVHETLCEREKLLADQFSLKEMPLHRGERECGREFTLYGPRSIRLGAVWASEHNTLYFYDARGERFLKLRLPHRLAPEAVSA